MAGGGGGKCTGIVGTRFRQMIGVIMALGFGGVAVSGVTTGTLTALEMNYGYTAKQLAIIIVAYDIGAVLSSPLAAHFGQRCLPVYLGSSVLLACLSLMVYGLASNMSVFFIAQFVAGFGNTTLWVLGPVHIDNNCINKALVPDFTGWLMAITPFGVIFGFMLAGGFLGECSSDDGGSESGCSSDGAAGVNTTNITAPTAGSPAASDCEGWRPPFFILAGLLAGPAVWFLLSRTKYPPPRTTKCCGDPPQKVGDAGVDAGVDAAAHHRGFLTSSKILACNLRFWLLCVGSGLHSFADTALVAFGPRFMERQLCQTKATASMLTGTLIPVISAGIFLGGWIPTKMNWGEGKMRHCILMMAVTTAMSVPLVVAAFSSDDIVIFLILAMIQFALMFVMSSPLVTCIERIVDEADKTAAVAIQNLAVRITGSIPGPIALGALLDAADSETEERRAYVVIGCLGLLCFSACLLWCWWLQRGYDQRDAARLAEEQTREMDHQRTLVAAAEPATTTTSGAPTAADAPPLLRTAPPNSPPAGDQAPPPPTDGVPGGDGAYAAAPAPSAGMTAPVGGGAGNDVVGGTTYAVSLPPEAGSPPLPLTASPVTPLTALTASPGDGATPPVAARPSPPTVPPSLPAVPAAGQQWCHQQWPAASGQPLPPSVRHQQQQRCGGALQPGAARGAGGRRLLSPVRSAGGRAAALPPATGGGGDDPVACAAALAAAAGAGRAAGAASGEAHCSDAPVYRSDPAASAGRDRGVFRAHGAAPA